jgi:CheY-like chemotaxis protein
MRVLIVEDDENKSRELVSFVASVIPAADSKVRRSLQSGVRTLRSQIFDLVLLDMTLPNYDAGPDEPGGGTIHSFGGKKFLQQMDRFEIDTPVVVVTQFEAFIGSRFSMDIAELNVQLAAEFPSIYRGIVYYHASLDDWRKDLADVIGGLLD